MKPTTPMICLTLVYGTVVGIGCSGKIEGGQASPVGPVQQIDLPAAAADAVCSNIGKCCTDWGFRYDRANCVKGFQAEVQETLDDAAESSGVVYDPEAAGACVALYRSVAGACVATEAQLAAISSACGAIWKGSKALGESCKHTIECAGADKQTAGCSVTFGADGGTSGVCTASAPSTAHGTLGGPCNETCRSLSGGSGECEGVGGTGSTPPAGAPACWADDGLFCDSTIWQCRGANAIGSPCASSIECVKGAFCKSQTCAARVALGSACEVVGFGETSCVDGAWCNSSNHLCEAKKKDGSPCSAAVECESGHCPLNLCTPANLAAEEDICGGG